MNVILSIDQSTAGTKGLLWDLSGRLLARSDILHRQITNDKGWVEHDACEIYANTLQVARDVLRKANIAPASVKAIGLSNQRETAVCWDGVTKQPVYNAIVWQCARAADITGAMKLAGMEETVKEKTGLNLSPFFSAAKFSWIVKHVEAAKSALQRGTLLCGTMDSWLVYKLTNGAVHKTDYSNASRTQLLNLDTLQWDEALAAAFGLTLSCLPEICMSDSLFGATTFEGLFSKPVPIHGVMGDSHAALFGNHCIRQGMAKATYGTGSSIMINAGAHRPTAGEGIVTSLAWGMNGSVVYVLEGNVNYTGAVTKWLVNDLELIADEKEAGVTASMVDSTGGVYLVPAFSGLGAPYFNSNVRAALVGMSRVTKKTHIVRAAEECIAYQIADVVEAINQAVKTPIDQLYVDGGPTHDKFLMQFQADILDMPLQISVLEEISGAGAAYCAALGSGLATEKEIFLSSAHSCVLPHMDASQRDTLYTGWQSAVKHVANNY